MRKDETPVDFAKKQGSIWEKTAQKEHFDAPEKNKSTHVLIIGGGASHPHCAKMSASRLCAEI